MLGGFGSEQDATDTVQKLCDQVKVPAEMKTGKSYSQFTAKSYREQVVAGTNYLIKVHVGEEEFIHLSLFWSLSCHGGGVQLLGVQEDKSEEDEIHPIETTEGNVYYSDCYLKSSSQYMS